jgi:hypothetical protein
MNTSHLDAREISKPGGLIEGTSNALKQALMAYFNFKDRQRQGERDMRRDERQMGRQQLQDALMQAERYGVAPRTQDSGWLSPGSDQLVAAARGKFGVAEAARAQAEKDAATNRERGNLTFEHQQKSWEQQLADRAVAEENKRMAEIEAGRAQPSQTQEDFYKDGLMNADGTEKQPPKDLLDQWDAQTRHGAAQAAAQKAAADAEQNAALKRDLLKSEVEKNNRGPVERHPNYERVQRDLLGMKAALAAGVDYNPPGQDTMIVSVAKLPAYIKTFEDWAAKDGVSAGQPTSPTAAPQPTAAKPGPRAFTRSDVESAVATRNAARGPNDPVWTVESMTAALKAQGRTVTE